LYSFDLGTLKGKIWKVIIANLILFGVTLFYFRKNKCNEKNFSADDQWKRFVTLKSLVFDIVSFSDTNDINVIKNYGNNNHHNSLKSILVKFFIWFIYFATRWKFIYRIIKHWRSVLSKYSAFATSLKQIFESNCPAFNKL
jgi:hypothetical protein